MMINKKLMTSALVAGTLGLVASANAVTIVHESFNYTAGALDGKSGGGEIGFDGAWTVGGTGDNPWQVIGGGGAAKRNSNSGGSFAHRSLTSSASMMTLTTDNSTMWFSIAYNGVDKNSNLTMALATSASTSGTTGELASAGYGVGFDTTNSSGTGRMEAIVYDGSTTFSRSVDEIPKFLLKNTDYHLAAKVNFFADGTPDEVYVFDITGLATEPLESAAVASLTVDIPLASQQLLRVLSLSDGQTALVDDIRFGATFDDVLTTVVPEPTTTALLGLGGLALILRRRK